MINKIRISDNADMIFSKDECGYSEVIDDFKNANTIEIVTFNISIGDSRILNQIKNLKETTNIEIITNIPNRFATYYTQQARNKARNNITSYMEQLNPEKFNPMVSSYFNFSNHSKIILTENIAYIGSANASDESDRNFEAGILIKDQNVIREIINNIIPMIKEDSKEYYGNGLSRYIILVFNLLSRIKIIKEEFHYSFYAIDDHRGADIEYYNVYGADLSPILIEEVENFLYEYNDIFNEIKNSSIFETHDLQMVNISNIIENIGELKDFADFDVNEKTIDYLDEDLGVAYDEDLDIYEQKAFDRASNEKFDMADEIMDNVIVADKGIEQIYDNIICFALIKSQILK